MVVIKDNDDHLADYDHYHVPKCTCDLNSQYHIFCLPKCVCLCILRILI